MRENQKLTTDVIFIKSSIIPDRKTRSSRSGNMGGDTIVNDIPEPRLKACSLSESLPRRVKPGC